MAPNETASAIKAEVLITTSVSHVHQVLKQYLNCGFSDEIGFDCFSSGL